MKHAPDFGASTTAVKQATLNQTSETTELDFLLMHLNEAKATALQSLDAARANSAALLGSPAEPPNEASAGIPAGGGLLDALDREMAAIRDINAETISHLMNIRKAINAL